MELWTVLKVLNWTVDFFKQKEVPSAKVNAEYIIGHVLEIPRLDVYLQFERILSLKERSEIKKLVVRRANREPLQYLLGETEFYGCRIKVNRNVLIPRPETELLVESILNDSRENTDILELCTGSGAVAIALYRNGNFNSIQASDISPKALETAKGNSEINGCNIIFKHSDLFGNISGKFDSIVANPPYIPEHEYCQVSPEVLREPQIALLADDEGLIFYKKIIRESRQYLKSGGRLYFETGHNQFDRIIEYAEKYNFKAVLCRKDFNDFDRVLVLEENNG